MRVLSVVFFGELVQKKLSEHEKFDMEVRRRELQTIVDELRTIVPNATFNLFVSSFSAGMVGSEEDVQIMEAYFASSPEAGSIIRDQPDMFRPAR